VKGLQSCCETPGKHKRTEEKKDLGLHRNQGRGLNGEKGLVDRWNEERRGVRKRQLRYLRAEGQRGKRKERRERKEEKNTG